jgi:NitT/TauT family transport system substrate-binding protein
MTLSRRQFTTSAVATSVAAALAPATSAIALEPQKLTVRTDFLPWGMHAGLHLAVDNSWFKDAGLDVDVSDGKGSTLTMQQVAAGDIEIGWVQLGAMASARGKGLPITSIAGFVRKADLGGLVPKESNVKAVKDLEGKKVVYTAASTWGSLVDVFFEAGGTSRDKIDLVSVDASALLSVYINKQADCTLTTYPFAKPVVDKQRPSKGLLFSDLGLNFPSYGLVVTEKTLASRQEALKRFVPVLVRAWEYIYDNHIDEAVTAMMRQRAAEKLDPDILKGQIVEYRPFFTTDRTKDRRYGWQSDDDWKDTLAILERTKLVPTGTRTTDYYTNTFVPS